MPDLDGEPQSDVRLLGGRQALVQLPVLQRQRDRARGWSTAGYISGYRGSPLGGYDTELWKFSNWLRENDIHFEPGVNEDLALVAVAGTQQLEFVPGRKVDGVFGFWYGKGPGVDRSGDAIKHANLLGVSAHGGVVLLFGDDHPGKSSTVAHQSDLTLASWGVPVLYPSSVAEILDLGLAAVAMSRFSGLLVGVKLVNETAELTATVNLGALRDFETPEVPEPPDGVHIRPELLAVQQQNVRLIRHKIPRARAFARANRLDKVVFGAGAPKFLIATAGKAFADVLEALEMLGIDQAQADRIGLAVYKIALIYPLDGESLWEAARGANEVFFIEEKQAHVETQAKEQFYSREVRPPISGKMAPDGTALLPSDLSLDGLTVAVALADRLQGCFSDIGTRAPSFRARAESIRARAAARIGSSAPAIRRPAFCPGCPHNTSTKVPEGAVGGTGIGCHGMVIFHPERNPIPMGHMGAEGGNWIGLSKFSQTPHIFQNLGDGTYNHSGSLAIRAAVQANVNITYKILLNDAVAMTGGQPVEGQVTVARMVDQLLAEGVKRVAVISEDPSLLTKALSGKDVILRHRDALEEVQVDLRNLPGVTALIYEQVCAAEKRRRRKVGLYPDPDHRMFVNALVCEGCGDCSTQSNCLAIQPLETVLGRKRRIDQSACNKDMTCEKGFCPSFVTVEGGRLRRVSSESVSLLGGIPDPQVPAMGDRFDMVIAGVGGTGVLTVSAILGMAAQLEGLAVNLFDMTGLSQKGGAVFSHIHLRRASGAAPAAKVGSGQAGAVLACDLVAAVQAECLEAIGPGTIIVANADIAATAGFHANRDLTIDRGMLVSVLEKAAYAEPSLLDATRLATDFLGNSISANVILLGFIWQKGGIPLSLSAMEQAIERNGKSVAANHKAFAVGRRAAAGLLPLDVEPPSDAEPSLDRFIAERTKDLAAYWNGRYARRYRDLMDEVCSASEPLQNGDRFAWAVARSAYKLMAYKDEYEVARLYSDGRFRKALEKEFEDVRTVKIHLAPPLIAPIDPHTGHPRKIAIGAWIMPLFRILANMRGLREGPFDIFRLLPERKLERALREAYLGAMHRTARSITSERLDEAMEIATAPLEVRGFGHVKKGRAEALLARLTGLGTYAA